MGNTTRGHVLVVDDDLTVAEVVSGYLMRAGYAVDRADEGQAALECAAAHWPDLVVLDLMLPGMSGFEVCRRPREKGPVPVIMLTARNTGLGLSAGRHMEGVHLRREVGAFVVLDYGPPAAAGLCGTRAVTSRRGTTYESPRTGGGGGLNCLIDRRCPRPAPRRCTHCPSDPHRGRSRPGALPTHPEALTDPHRPGVLHIQPRVEPVRAKSVDGKPGQRHGRLSHIAAPLVTWVESPADLGLGGAGIGQGERHLAKDAGLTASAHSKRQLVPVGTPDRVRRALGRDLLAALPRVAGRYK